MKKYNVYYYRYKFDVGYWEGEYVDTIYLDESETICDGIRQAKLDHDLYRCLENIGCDTWELTSEHTKDFYHIILKEK